MVIFTDGNLILWDKGELERAEKEVLLKRLFH
jgi:hypothetical protein